MPSMRPQICVVLIAAVVVAGSLGGARATDHERKLDPEAAAECAFWGGEVMIAISGEEFCQRPTIDAGRVCSAQSDCDSVCLADSGQCSAETPLLGCYRVMTSNGDSATICFD